MNAFREETTTLSGLIALIAAFIFAWLLIIRKRKRWIALKTLYLLLEFYWGGFEWVNRMALIAMLLTTCFWFMSYLPLQWLRGSMNQIQENSIDVGTV